MKNYRRNISIIMQSQSAMICANAKNISVSCIVLTLLSLIGMFSVIFYYSKPKLSEVILLSTANKQLTINLDILHSRKQLMSSPTLLYSSNQRASRRFLSSSSEARCIDGSTPAYYIRKGRDEGANKWVIHFEGGGWCYDLQACYLRSKTGLGSSKGYPDTMRNSELPLYLSDYSTVNPLMHNWNAVYVKYCDGSSYAGNTIADYKGNVTSMNSS